MLQEKKISSKINYEVLKSLNVSLNNSTKEQQKVEEPVQSPKKEMNISSSSNKMLVYNIFYYFFILYKKRISTININVYIYRSNISNSSKIKDKPITPVVKKPHVDKPEIQKTKKEVQMPVEIETNTTESILPKMDTSCDMGKLLISTHVKFLLLD